MKDVRIHIMSNTYEAYYGVCKEDLREMILGPELMEFEEMCNNIQAAMAPTVVQETTHQDGGYYEHSDSHVKRMYWWVHGQSSKLNDDVADALEVAWCCYHYFKTQYIYDEKTEQIIGNTETNECLYLRKLLETQKRLGWIFNCEFTMKLRLLGK
jgi:hypothetical protein